MRVAVTGARGRMGRLIVENVASAADMELAAAFDIVGVGERINDVSISSPDVIGEVIQDANPDVLVDFTAADAAMENIRIAAENKVNLVVGTTGFTNDQRQVISDVVDKSDIAAVVSPNFSIGVNVFWKLIEEASKYLREYDVEIMEAHHRGKKDAPSGTALKAAEILSSILGGRKLVFGREGLSPRADEIGIHSIRAGDIVGEHTVLYAGDGERIEITHRAHSRQTFAAGAIKAARWVMEAEPGLYSMSDVLGL